MRRLTRKHEARARNMAKRGKRIAASAQRGTFAEEAARYRKADHLFMRAYGYLRFKS
jgi:hypothetical protein